MELACSASLRSHKCGRFLYLWVYQNNGRLFPIIYVKVLEYTDCIQLQYKFRYPILDAVIKLVFKLNLIWFCT